ncbi:hypothetical protein D3C81_1336090 [compost metagenome]
MAIRLVGHTVVYILIPPQITQVGQEGMTAVQHTQLHLFKRQYVIYQLRTGQFPGRTACDKIIFHHPLDKGLAGDGAFITYAAQCGSHFIERFRGGGWNNAVDHSTGETDLLGNPICQGTVTRLRQADDGVAQYMAVFGNIIAREQGKGGQTAFQAQAQGFDQNAGYRNGLRGVGKIGADPLVLQIQFPATGFDAVAFFGDGH